METKEYRKANEITLNDIHAQTLITVAGVTYVYVAMNEIRLKDNGVDETHTNINIFTSENDAMQYLLNRLKLEDTLHDLHGIKIHGGSILEYHFTAYGGIEVTHNLHVEMKPMK